MASETVVLLEWQKRHPEGMGKQERCEPMMREVRDGSAPPARSGPLRLPQIPPRRLDQPRPGPG